LGKKRGNLSKESGILFNNYLSSKEIKFIGRQIKNSRDKLIFELLVNTGINLNELINIRVNDFDFKKNSLKIYSDPSRAKLERNVFFSEKLKIIIKKYIKENNLKKDSFLLSTRQSIQISERRVQQILNYYSINKKIIINPRTLRQSYIINSFLKKTPVEKIMQNIGIKNLNPYFFNLLKIIQKKL
jgi:site-specific recombinase XerD